MDVSSFENFSNLDEIIDDCNCCKEFLCYEFWKNQMRWGMNFLMITSIETDVMYTYIFFKG